MIFRLDTAKQPNGQRTPLRISSTEDLHNIKKEGIGLIEAMGLFILRLKKIALMISSYQSKH